MYIHIATLKLPCKNNYVETLLSVGGSLPTLMMTGFVFLSMLSIIENAGEVMCMMKWINLISDLCAIWVAIPVFAIAH